VNSGGLVDLVGGGLLVLLWPMNPFDSLMPVCCVDVGGSLDVRDVTIDDAIVPMVDDAVEHSVQTIDELTYGGGGTGEPETVGGLDTIGVSVVIGGPPGKRVIRMVELLTQDVEEDGGG
jgi:hypothetical protein